MFHYYTKKKEVHLMWITKPWLICGLAICIGLAASVGHAGTWTAASEPDSSPTDPLWSLVNGSASDRTFVPDEYLRIDTMQAGAAGYHTYELVGPEASDWGVENAVQFRVRILDVKEGAQGAGSLTVYSPNGDGTCDLYQVRLGEGTVGLQDETRTFRWSSVDTADWHDYTLFVDPTAYAGAGEMSLYQDGIFIDSQKPRPNVGLDWNGMRWGDLSNSDESGISDWNSIAWEADVIPEPSTLALLATAGLFGLALRRKGQNGP